MASPEFGVGPTLQNRRRQKSLSIEKVAHDTRIHSKFIKALEAEQWEEFPAHVYRQGFLRRYAAYLGLDGDELARQLNRQTGQP